jgi:hypothetical protein
MPATIAGAIAEEMGRDVDYRPAERAAAARAAAAIAELLSPRAGGAAGRLLSRGSATGSR